jgi:hypothetical protein
MPDCTFNGNADMYGLGIRIGFYLLWFGAPIASILAPVETRALQLSKAIFIFATFIALIILVVRNELQIVEIYVILLLCFGSYLSLIPLYIWRLITCCAPEWDPSRFPVVDMGPLFSYLNFLLLIAVAIFQLWYWCNKVPELNRVFCTQYGFIFGQVALNDKAFQVFNVVLYFILLLSCVIMVAMGIARHLGYAAKSRVPRVRVSRARFLQTLDVLLNLSLISVIVAATETTIRWNHIVGVNEINSAGQTIPLIIGAVQLAIVFYRYLSRGVYDDSDSVNSYWDDSRIRSPLDPLPVDRLPTSVAIESEH